MFLTNPMHMVFLLRHSNRSDSAVGIATVKGLYGRGV
jgi:hypothetical protein